MNIKYKIEIFTDWHCGSGLAAGADVDTLVIKDKNGLPYIPGKTIKGLIKEATVEILGFSTTDQNVNCDESFIKTFGYFSDDKKDMHKGEAFFSNATLSEEEQAYILEQQLTRFMYRKTSSTAISANGVAKEHSLRKTEVVVPCSLYGEILNIPDENLDTIKKALKFIKRLGVGRNRGLGRCQITIQEGGKK